MNEPLPILIIEDMPTDAELCQREVSKALPASRFLRVETREDFLAALEKSWTFIQVCLRCTSQYGYLSVRIMGCEPLSSTILPFGNNC